MKITASEFYSPTVKNIQPNCVYTNKVKLGLNLYYFSSSNMKSSSRNASTFKANV